MRSKEPIRVDAEAVTTRLPGRSEVKAGDNAGPSRAMVLTCVLLACVAILFFRKSDAFTRPQLWAEDGATFFSDARNEGWRSLLKPYRGSLYLAQRLVSLAGNWVPVRYVPHFYNLAALLATLGVVTFVLCSRTSFRSKALLGIAVVAAPHVGEVFMNLTNVGWILALAMVIFIVSEDAKTIRRALIEAVALTVLCLTGPFILMLAPFFVLRAVLKRSPYSWMMGAIAIVCSVIALVNLSADRIAGHVNFSDPNWMGFFGNHLSGLLFLGRDLTDRIPNSKALASASALVFGLLVYLAVRSRDRDCLVFLGAAVAVVAATAHAFRGGPNMSTDCMCPPIGHRYSYIPTVCVVWALLLILERRGRAAPVVGLLLVLVCLSSTTMLPDLHWAEASKGIGGPVPCHVPINPEPWVIFYCPKNRPLEEIQLPLRPAAVSKMKWDGQEWLAGDKDSALVFALEKPRFVCGVTVEHHLTTKGGSTADFKVAWRKGDGRQERTKQFSIMPAEGTKPLTIWVFDTIDQLRIEPGDQASAYEPTKLRLSVLSE
jgi:hypothetical protein